MEQMTAILENFWSVLADMAPYLLFGFLMAGILSVVIRPESVERHLGGRGIWATVKATVVLPLGSVVALA